VGDKVLYYKVASQIALKTYDLAQYRSAMIAARRTTTKASSQILVYHPQFYFPSGSDLR